MSPNEFEQVSQRQGKIAARIFQLREQVGLHLQANNVDAVNKLLCLISALEAERVKR